MMYSIYLGSFKLGTTKLEKSDPPMGVVFGVIEFSEESIGYSFIRDFCEAGNIQIAVDFPEDKLISTRTIESLIVKNEFGIEIKGIGNQITGMDSMGFEVSLEGVPYPFYEEEFPHHVKAYDEMF